MTDNDTKDIKIGSAEWNNDLFLKHPTPYTGISGKIEFKRAKRIYKLIKKYHKKNVDTLLEIGCEQGNLLNFLSEKLPETTLAGTDISGVALEKAAEVLPEKVILKENDITQETPKDLGVQDVLICSEVLEHIPDYKSAIANISEMATKDTLVIITVPLEKHKNNIKKTLVKLGLFNLLFKGIEEGLSEWHVNDFSKEDITNELSKYFEIHHYELLWLLHQIIVLKKK